jgi:hypothetical protein
MSNNEIIRWEPKISNFPKTVHIMGIYDDYEGFRIIVREEGKTNLFRFKFDNYVAYRNADEGARIKSISLFPNDSREWCLFKTQNNEFVDWIVNESSGIYLKESITNYIFATPNDIIEVLSLDEPEIEEL